ncbi:hypothetical protein ACHAW5_001065 [Stephanodiscus triporus]|uniref:RING-type E3 ubiquitin transferase n=1 Tax=Stephanodiscus triporus TaxID=2934178 RepID=A0ABD3QK73_9STRA
MPKRQKEKQYQSAREHRANQSIRSGSSSSLHSSSRPLPFDCCALTLTPYAAPVCTADGVIFDNAAITPHLMRHRCDPITGRPMTSRDLIVLNMDRDESTGRWQCPVLNRPFTDRTAVVAIRQTPPGNEANVYSREAYRELNVKAKNYLDLTSGLKFDPKVDVITLQDPDDEDLCRLRDIRNFAHIRQLREEEALRQQNEANVVGSNVTHSVTAARIMEKLDREKRKRERSAEDRARKLLLRTDDHDHDDDDAPSSSSTGVSKGEKVSIYTDELLTSVNLTSGRASGSLTSTTMAIVRENKARLATEEEIIASQCEQLGRLKKKGMVRVFTNMGAMDVEVHCDIVPRTAMNFLLLARNGEYDGCKFHRSIPNFMIQGGKKPGIKGGDGGGSAWERPFPDEFDDRLTHAGPGVVSMANSGPGTNGRQFFITYKSCAHLDRKHSVFGRVVGGLEILRRLEEVPTDKETDRPLETVRIESIEIIDNPVDEALEIERARILKRKDEKRMSELSRKTPVTLDGSIEGAEMDKKSGGVRDYSGLVEVHSTDDVPAIGKYLISTKKDSKKRTKPSKLSKNGGDEDVGQVGETTSVSRLPPPPKKTTFGRAGKRDTYSRAIQGNLENGADDPEISMFRDIRHMTSAQWDTFNAHSGMFEIPLDDIDPAQPRKQRRVRARRSYHYKIGRYETSPYYLNYLSDDVVQIPGANDDTVRNQAKRLSLNPKSFFRSWFKMPLYKVETLAALLVADEVVHFSHHC